MKNKQMHMKSKLLKYFKWREVEQSIPCIKIISKSAFFRKNHYPPLHQLLQIFCLPHLKSTKICQR